MLTELEQHDKRLFMNRIIFSCYRVKELYETFNPILSISIPIPH